MSDEKQETIDDIVREMSNLGKLDEKSTDKSSRSLMGLGFRTYADRIKAAARRAYNEIDSSVCGIDSATSSDIDDVRKAMDKTIGDYYE